MATRRRMTDETPARGGRRAFDDGKAPTIAVATSYFASSEKRSAAGLQFVSTGCAVLDQALGGGMVLGRMINVVGDKSTGKTLLAIEACANFIHQYPDGVIRYAEAESAFDKAYAEALGMPVDRVDFADFLKSKKKGAARGKRKADDEESDRDVDKDATDEPTDIEAETDRTVEYLFEDIQRTLRTLKGRPCLYVVDSLDALSDRVEKAKKEDEGSYGMQKAKALHALFRRLNGEIEASRMLFMIISQVKDKIGVSFGETKTRTGGHALDFFASQILWLAHMGYLHKEIDGIKRAIGIDVRGKVKKNKVGLPFREADFPLLFGYGIDDMTAAAEWLIENGLSGRLSEVEMSQKGYKTRIQSLRNKGGFEARAVRETLSVIVAEEWARIETKFLPAKGKYA